MRLFIINDTHLGVKRQTGTTQQSREALSKWMYRQFQTLLEKADGHDLCVLGDLFDTYQVSKRDEIQAYGLLSAWQKRNPDRKLILAAGNHDLSTNSKDISSFENLCVYLSATGHKGTEAVLRRAHFVYPHLAVLSHVDNQKIFDDEIEKLLENNRLKFLLLHCNYDNHFAEEADHSLNLSAETAEKFAAKGVTLVFAHEHQQRRVGNVHIIGNQFPSSISDCLGNDYKQYAVILEDSVKYYETLDIHEIFVERDWREALGTNVEFVRLTGTADYTEAAEVIQRLAEVRKTSNSFVITNAVRVGQAEADLPDADGLKSFDLRRMVEDSLPEGLRRRFAEVSNFAQES